MLDDNTVAEINAGVVALLRSDLTKYHQLAVRLNRTPDQLRLLVESFDRMPIWILWDISEIYEVSIDRVLSGWAFYDDTAMQAAIRETLEDALPEMDTSFKGLKISEGRYRFVGRATKFLYEHSDYLASYLVNKIWSAYNNYFQETCENVEVDTASGLYDPWTTVVTPSASHRRSKRKPKPE